MRKIFYSVILSLLFVFSITSYASAALSWQCNTLYSAEGGFYMTRSLPGSKGSAESTYAISCYSASISGSIDAAISSSDKTAIANLVTGSSILSNINTYASNASSYASSANTKLGNSTYGLNAIKNAVNTASSNASSASSYASSANTKLNNSTYGLNAIKNAVNTASSNASSASSYASSANTKLDNSTYGLNAIKNAVNTASSNASSAADRSWDNAESKSVATLSKEARDKSTETLNKVNSLEKSVTKIQNSIAPIITKVSGLNGATCTETSNFTVVIQGTGATEYRACIDFGPYTDWDVSRYITFTEIPVGTHTVNVQAKNINGVTSDADMLFFRI